MEAIARVHEGLHKIYKEFVLVWRDIEAAHKFSTTFDTGTAAAAAAFVAQAEDDLLFNGNREMEDMEGFMNASGRNTIQALDWGTAGAVFENVVTATQTLIENGFFGPFA